MAHHDALMHIYNLLEQDYNLVKSALEDLQELKRERHPSLPDSIRRALERIIGRTKQSSLHDTLYASLLKPDSPLWEIDDPGVRELRRMNAEVNSEQLQLYLNIKGFTRNLVDFYHDGPNRETHPVNYIVHMLKAYGIEERKTYAPIKLVLDFLDKLQNTIRWYEILDQDMVVRRSETRPEDNIDKLRYFCGRHSEFFGPFLTHIFEPFLFDMNVYRGHFIKISADIGNYSYALAAYKEQYKPQQLERIRGFLLDVAQVLRGIPYEDEIKINLCQNIAFSIETTCGLYDPLESLFEKATPIMIRSMDRHKRGPSPNMFEAKRARR
jgi:hypothetical protein